MSRENQTQYPKTEVKQQVNEYGGELIEAMSEEERDTLGSKWSTLHFKTLLGLDSIKTTRNNGKPAMKPVGVILQSDIDIDDVPVIDVTLDNDTGVDIEKDIKSRKVCAGEEFALSYYEFLFLVIRDEYAAFISYNGYRAVCLSNKITEFLEYMNKDRSFKVREGDDNPEGYNRIKLPTPTITFVKVKVKGKNGKVKVMDFGSMRDKYIIPIDEQLADKTWIISEEFKDDEYITRFIDLIPKDKRAK